MAVMLACAGMTFAQDTAPAGSEKPAAAAPASDNKPTAPADTKVAPAEPLTFHKTLAAAQREASQKNQVTAAYFTASWCHWCRKMSDTTLRDPRVVAVAGRFTWAKIDIDRQPETAAVFDVRGVPALVLLNTDGEVIDASAGYLSVEQMLALLNKSVDQAEGPGAAAKLELTVKAMHDALAAAKTDADTLAAVMPVVELLARPDRRARAWLSGEIAKINRTGWLGLLGAMRDKRLAVRAAAADALATAAKLHIPFDPFADEATRSKQLLIWDAWLHKPTKPTLPAPKAPDKPDAKPGDAN
jgi:thioredoxin